MSSAGKGTALALKRAGATRLELGADGNPKPFQEAALAAWQNEHPNILERVVIRCDGLIQRWQDTEGLLGVPCAVLRVDYAIGGFSVSGASAGAATAENATAMRTCYVDCVNQSALAVWASSVEVVPVWDQRRIARLAEFSAELENHGPRACKEQVLAAALSVGDYSPCDARWLDVITYNNLAESGTSRHPIPPGARSCRFLNATRDTNGAILEIKDVLTAVQWSSSPDDSIDQFIHQDIPPDSSGCALDVPAGAAWMFLRFAQLTEVTMTCPFWVEWLLSPDAL